MSKNAALYTAPLFPITEDAREAADAAHTIAMCDHETPGNDALQLAEMTAVFGRLHAPRKRPAMDAVEPSKDGPDT
jgi:hypothetical protein